MDLEKWWIVLSTGAIAAIFVIFLIIVINTVGRRGQAITWLPVSLATILALQHITEPESLNTMLEAAYASQFISAIFIITFYFSVDSASATAVWLAVTLSVLVPAAIVWAICHHLNAFWAFFVGTLGNILIFFFLRVAPPLEFEQKSYNMSCRKFVCNLTEVYLLTLSSVLTVVFIVIPAVLSDLGYVDIAGIVSNMPKVSFFVMLNLWVQKRGCCKIKKATERIDHELKEHLTMFSYSTSITTIFLVLIWFNENEKNPENFWWGWSAAFFLSTAIVIGVLTPLCISKPARSKRRKFEQGGSSFVPTNRLLKPVQDNQLKL